MRLNGDTKWRIEEEEDDDVLKKYEGEVIEEENATYLNRKDPFAVTED